MGFDKRVLLPIGFALAVLILAVMLYWDRMPTPQVTGGSAVTTEAAQVGPGAAAVSSAKQRKLQSPDASGQRSAGQSPTSELTSKPLPKADVPLRQSFEELKVRTDVGDRRAACRFAMELRKCQLAAAMRDSVPVDEVTVAAEQPDDSKAARLLAVMRERIHHCDGVTSDQLALAFDYQQRAAELGDVTSELNAALFPALDFTNVLDQAPQWERWRGSAMRFLEDAASRGEPVAVRVIFGAYAGGEWSALRQRAVQPDPARAYVYGALWRHLVASGAPDGADLARIEAQLASYNLSDRARMHAQQEADERFQQHFGGLVPDNPNISHWQPDDVDRCAR